jgi:hypothetical protein
MSVACEAEDCGRYLWESDTSNKALEWTGRHQRSASTFLSLPATQGQRSKDRENRDAIIRDRRAWQHTGLHRRPDADSNQ